MRLFSLFDCWKPQLRLNTDILPIYKLKQSEKVTLLTSSASVSAKKGDLIKTGEFIAEDCISPYTGVVESVRKIQDLDLETFFSISLAIQAKEECIRELQGIKNITDASKGTLLSHIKGLGFNFSPEVSVDTVVVNVLDRDPVCTVNQQLFRENTGILKESLQFIKKITGCNRVILAVTRQLMNVTKRNIENEVEIVVVDPMYPNGLPEILLQILFPGGEDITGKIVVAMENLLAMYRAVKSGKPCRDKAITITALDQSIEKNIQVNMGTPLREIFQEMGISVYENSKVIVNGVMSGVALYDFEYPVTKHIHSIFVQKEKDVYKTENNPCINCGKCVAACPVHLQVNLICRYSEYRLFDECQRLDVAGCIECGLCAYGCTARRPLIHYIRHAKVTLSQQKEEKVS